VLYNPEHIPCKNLQLNNNVRFGISARQFVTKAMIVVIRRHYLLETFLINSRARSAPQPPPK